MSNSNDIECGSGDESTSLSKTTEHTRLQPPMMDMQVVYVRNDEGICPLCKNKFYIKTEQEEEKSRLMCKRCKYAWFNRIESPSKCPRCGSYAWNKPTLKCDCNVCSHQWISRKKEGPARCPSCNSTRWNEEPASLDITVRDEDAKSFNKKNVIDRYIKGKGCVSIASDLGLPLFKVMAFIRKEIEPDLSPRL